MSFNNITTNSEELPENIFWHENCSDSDLNSLYESSDCLIQASYAEDYGYLLLRPYQKQS